MSLVSPAKLKVVAGYLLVGGAICGLISLVAIMWTYQWLRHADSAETTIVALEERKVDGRIHFAPRFTFEDQKEASHTVHSSSSIYPPRYQVGDRVTVFYHLDHPEKARLPDFFSLWGLSFVTGLLTVTYSIGGWLLWRFAKRRSQLGSASIKPLATPPAHP